MARGCSYWLVAALAIGGLSGCSTISERCAEGYDAAREWPKPLKWKWGKKQHACQCGGCCPCQMQCPPYYEQIPQAPVCYPSEQYLPAPAQGLPPVPPAPPAQPNALPPYEPDLPAPPPPLKTEARR